MMNYIRFFEILKTMKKNTCCTSMCKKYEATTLAKVTVQSSCDDIPGANVADIDVQQEKLVAS